MCDSISQNLNQGTLERLSAILHTLSCTKPHAERMEELIAGRKEGVCYYFLEEILADNRIDHEDWINRTRAMCIECNIMPEEALRVLPKLLEIKRNLNDVLERSPNSAKLSRLILSSELR